MIRLANRDGYRVFVCLIGTRTCAKQGNSRVELKKYQIRPHLPIAIKTPVLIPAGEQLLQLSPVPKYPA